ncbi:phenylalanine--tRNA ligase subunit beta [Nonomuraea sp. 3-1Str]|uniref:phenylalanine--tRNA ligase subunit beta n=1 Tax=Nonomuraea sp. 3-1Str TaxID=2929801 RepID=UPI00285F9526|nr:phenylalanine--tRNA ligase subunit beta [Nonomuraea sp. 3-1Str]MDR8414089.1 phenylalanine--tRNA ligase subunit beta [Nonomuraea sp. 3-1Str]
MKLSVVGLRAFLPELPHDLARVRAALDESGLEVKSVESDGSDSYVTLEFLANRGDHRSYAGVATELAARLHLPLTLPPVERPEVGDGPIRVAVESAACLAYSLTRLTVLDPKATLRADVTARLAAEDLLTGSALVDAANAAALELGQPTHAFDADRVSGTVHIRASRSGERAHLIGEREPRSLPAGLPVVADEEKILAVAGVLGCEESRVRDGTRRVLLESAAYDPVAVRKAAAAIGVSTAASQRYERGSDPTAVLQGAGRVIRLLEEAGAAERDGPSIVPVRWTAPPPRIALDPETCSDFLGIQLGLTDMESRLGDYGFRHEGNGEFSVPGSRIWDVKEPEDLYEELARHIGFDTLPARPLPAGPGAPLTPKEELVQAIGGTLVGLGFYETFTEGFYGKETLRLLSPAESGPLARHVRILNAEDRRYSMLKNNCLAQAVAAVSANLRFKQGDVRLFEVTRVFEPDATADNGLCHEHEVIWAVALGSRASDQWSGKAGETDVFFLRGAVEEIALRCRADIAFRPIAPANPLAEVLHPHRGAEILLDGRYAGLLGEVHPDVRRRAGLGGNRPCYLELRLDAWKLRKEPARRPPFHEDPGVERMVDFVMPRPVLSQDVLAVMTAVSPSWVRSIRVGDVFVPDGAAPGERSVTYVITCNSEPVRSAGEVNAMLQSFIETVTGRFAGQGVRLR